MLKLYTKQDRFHSSQLHIFGLDLGPKSKGRDTVVIAYTVAEVAGAAGVTDAASGVTDAAVTDAAAGVTDAAAAVTDAAVTDAASGVTDAVGVTDAAVTVAADGVVIGGTLSNMSCSIGFLTHLPYPRASRLE